VQGQLWPGASDSLMVAGTLFPRFLLALAAIVPLCLRHRPLATPKEISQGLWIGGFATVGMILQTDGLRYTAASTSAFLTQFYAISIPVYLALRQRRAPPWRVGVSAVLVLIGVAILGHFDWRELRLGHGEVETLAASLFFMWQILWLDHPAYRENRALPVTAVMMAIQTIVFLGLAVAAAPSWEVWGRLVSSPSWWGLILVLALPCTVLTYLIMNRWQPCVSATEAGLIYCFEPIFGSLQALCLPALFARWAGVAYVNETLTFSLLIGGGLVTVANILIQLKPPARPA
jgi:drug/metabolite transporter (DMT)-like permease